MLAVYNATAAARSIAVKENRPVLIEAMTYRYSDLAPVLWIWIRIHSVVDLDPDPVFQVIPDLYPAFQLNPDPDPGF